MKVRRRTTPLDMMSVEQKDQSVIVFTHHSTITMVAYKDNRPVETHEFTFDQFYSLITNLKPGIQNHVP